MNEFFNNIQINSSIKNTLNSVSFNYNYLNDKESGYRIYAFTNGLPDNLMQNIMIISAFGSVNPRFKVTEIYANITKIAEFLSLDMSGLFIFLDLIEFIGIKEKYFFKWEFKEQNGNVSDSIKDIFFQEMSYSENKIIEDYNGITKSIIFNTHLNSKQIIDIMAFVLRDKCYDDITIEHMVKNFKLSLKKLQDEKSLSKKSYSELQVL